MMESSEPGGRSLNLTDRASLVCIARPAEIQTRR
jgi:hypothetical protein